MKTEDWNKLNEIFHKALELDLSERKQFIEDEFGDDEGLKKEVLKLIESAESETDFLNDNAIGDISDYADVIEDFEGKQIDDYKILKEIGHGGMGAVYLAEHKGEGFTQKVALKLIKRGMDTNAVLKRFLLERQILASLEHPNIARLLDGGSTEDGLPYFAMEYIEGEPLRKFCDNQQFETNKRLEIFLKVCRAVSYAHQKLVVHRDIKPSNIIVTNDGIPKLLDFGIGKILSPNWNESTAEATATQMRLMTPEYASPEQIRGQMTTTATDVYSLGVVLYELLTGTRPYKFESSNPIEISEKLSTEEPVKPSDATGTEGRRDGETERDKNIETEENLSSSLPPHFSPSQLKGDLDNIILKAIQKDTERRYKSVEEFADDIERFLKGLPVSATADSGFYRFQKFVKRHRTGVFSAFAFAVLLIGATGITTWQYFKAQQAQAKAEQRFTDVRKLANSVVFDLHDAIQNLPGATPARELLVRNALEYLDKLAKEAEGDTALQIELADAYDKIGDVQGGSGGFHLGQRKKAKESYEKALAIRQKLLNSEPNNPLYRRKIAASYAKLSNIFLVQANTEESLKLRKKALGIYEKLAEGNPDDSSLQIKLSETYANVAYLYTITNKTPQDDEYHQKAISIANDLVSKNSGDETFIKNLATAYEFYGISLSTKQKYKQDLKFYKKAFEIWQKLSSKNPQNISFKVKYASLNYALGVAVYNANEKQISAEAIKESLKYLNKAKDVYSELLEIDPKNKDFQLRFLDSETIRASLFSELGNPQKAIDILENILNSFTKLIKESPTEKSLLSNASLTREQLGEAYRAIAKDKKSTPSEQLKHWKIARDYYQKAYNTLKSFRDSGDLVFVEIGKTEAIKKRIDECNTAITSL